MADIIIHHARWSPSSLVVWGPALSIPRGGPTVHLPGTLGAYGCSTGATAACMAKRKRNWILSAWTFRFATACTHRLCKRCFPDGKPNRKYRPAAGWFRYVWSRKGGRPLPAHEG